MTNHVPALSLNALEYLETTGLNVMLAHDFYPEGHQGGVSFIHHGLRVATNGDLRLETSPGQWSPIPKVGAREVNPETGEISVRMEYPDLERHRVGFNPIEYPDLQFAYSLQVRPEGTSFRIIVDLDQPLPADWIGRVGLNLEFFPGYFFGKTFSIGNNHGIFPRDPVAPGRIVDEVYEIDPLGKGQKATFAAEDSHRRVHIEVIAGGDLQLIDGRGLHNNGWFLLRSLVDSTRVEWLVTPSLDPTWFSPAVVQISQVGYLTHQEKIAVIERDSADARPLIAELHRIDPDGLNIVKRASPTTWGRFLRYRYEQFDFSEVTVPGMYLIAYDNQLSSPFKIGDDVFERGVWQPTVDTFLPVQMCHMRVEENYRVWHGRCHLDDAVMAPTSLNHFDGYVQGDSTLCPFEPGDRVPGLAVGGWHDAGDYDLRIESQADTVQGLALAYEEFQLNHDDTTVDQEQQLVKLRCPDGVPDILQQVEHGLLTILAGYRALGRFYRGVIERSLDQYVHLGDAATQTDNVPSDDDRWVFTEVNPPRERSVAATLAIAARVIHEWRPALAEECLAVARKVYEDQADEAPLPRLELATELLLATNEPKYRQAMLDLVGTEATKLSAVAPALARAVLALNDPNFTEWARQTVQPLADEIEAQGKETPYGLPYRPAIWGAGWGIQRFGVRQYWLHRAFPELFSSKYLFKAVDFMLGCHPGPNNVSFVSGVGAKSLIPGYGVNRAEFSYIPGGIGSGTALIRPDFPELLEWPYLWQQTEYCAGHPTSDFVFLIAAAEKLHGESLARARVSMET